MIDLYYRIKLATDANANEDTPGVGASTLATLGGLES